MNFGIFSSKSQHENYIAGFGWSDREFAVRHNLSKLQEFSDNYLDDADFMIEHRSENYRYDVGCEQGAMHRFIAIYLDVDGDGSNETIANCYFDEDHNYVVRSNGQIYKGKSYGGFKRALRLATTHWTEVA